MSACETETSSQSLDSRAREYVKQSRDGLKRYKKSNTIMTHNQATNIVLAVMRAPEWHWLMNLSGWASDTIKEYCKYSMIENTSKRSTDDEEYHSCKSDVSNSNNSKDSISELDSWIWIDPKELAVMNQEQEVSQEYIEFQHLFKQSEQSELLNYGLHDHWMPLMEGKDPACKKIYPMSEKESKALQEYIDKQLKEDIIRPSKLPAGHGVLFVSKKDDELWLCIDYQSLNVITIKDRHPLPWIDKMQDHIRGAKWFTKLNITDVYYQLQIVKEEEWKTVFQTKYEHYEYLVMSFRLTNALALFQRFINEVCEEYLDMFMIVYLDDILIFLNTLEEHIQHVRAVLRKFENTQLQLKLKKCEFHVQETESLGHWITTADTQMEKTKVQAIRDWPELKSIKKIQQFTGLMNYYWWFLKNYLQFMAPLFKLLKKRQKFYWRTEQKEAFEKAKQSVMKESTLAQYNPAKPSMIETNASDYTIGMISTQPEEDEKPWLIAFHLWKLIQVELNYNIHDKELLAIVVAFKTWRTYLEEAQHTVLVKTDNKNLTFFTMIKVLTRRQAKWAEVLLQYDFKIMHCRGNENGQADALSVTAILVFGMLMVAESSGLVIMWSHTPTDGYISWIILNPYFNPSWSFTLLSNEIVVV